MKNLYQKSKSKIKIHPSPTPPSTSANGDALGVLTLLPAAILTLTEALSMEDKEVIAYLMSCSINGSVSAAEEERRRIAGVHRPLFDCSCFDCYTSFWSRWDCSRDGETIHLVIEAFEEHLARKEKKVKEPKRKRKRKKGTKEEKSGILALAEVNKGVKEKEKVAVSASDGCFAAEERTEDEEEVESPPATDDKRKLWAEVMGIFNSRLWSLWGPGV